MKTSLTIPDKMSEKLSQISDRTGLSKSEIIRAGVFDHLNRKGLWKIDE
jgi:predicted DNA-binding protein